MTKIHVRGSAQTRFDADLMTLTLTIRAAAETSGEALRCGRARTEALLALLEERFGIAPEDVRLEGESVQLEYGQTERNVFRMTMRLEAAADPALADVLSGALEELDNIAFDTSFDLRDRKAAEQRVVAAALDDARAKAELIAAATGGRVVGAEDIRYEVYGSDGVREAAFKADNAMGMERGRASRLSLPEIVLEKELTVVWLVE